MSNGYMKCLCCKYEYESEEWWHCPKCKSDKAEPLYVMARKK